MMNTTAVTILLPVFMREFQTDIITTQWVVTAYILATCTVAPVVGYLSDRHSLKRTFLLAVSGFAVSTLLLGLVNHIYPFIALRVLQGIFGRHADAVNPIHDLPPVSTAKTGRRPLASGATTNLLAPTPGAQPGRCHFRFAQLALDFLYRSAYSGGSAVGGTADFTCRCCAKGATSL